EYTSRAARDEGMVALEASGVETESELPFAALGELLAEILPRSAEIPDRQAAVLASALGVGKSVPVDRFTVCAAALHLLAAQAERRPVAVVVDDAHWLDRSSAEALLFAARRLDNYRVAFLFALRPGAPA